MIVALALSPSLDITYEVEELHQGDITRPTRVTRVAGGKALNVVRVAHHLGGSVHAIAALGGHTGAWIAEMLRADGVSVDVVPTMLPTRMCSAIVEERGADSSTDLYEPATALDEGAWHAFQRMAEAVVVDDSAWIAVSGSLPAGVDRDEVVGLLGRLRARGSRIALDSSGLGLAAMVSSADLVKVNRSEACGLLRRDDLTAEDAARAMHERWGSDAVVTDGVRGGFAVVGGAGHTLPVPLTRGRFSAGSGDAFLGGLLAGLDAGHPPGEALAQAADAAERNAAVPGQGILG